jgi:hypothetical protein
LKFTPQKLDEVEPLKVQPINALHRCKGDGEILDRQAGRVEHGYVLLRPAALAVSREYVAELRYVVAAERARLDRMHEVAVVTRLLPAVANPAASDEAERAIRA